MFDNPAGIIIVVFIVVLLFVGPKQLPRLSRSVGESFKELKAGFKDDSEDKSSDDDAAASESKTSDSDKTAA